MLEREDSLSILKLLSVVAVHVEIVAVQSSVLYQSRKATQFFSVYVTTLCTHKKSLDHEVSHNIEILLW